MQAFSSLGIELLKYGYRSFATFQMYCPQHGLLRVNLEIGAGRWPCPICHVERECSPPLAHGYTRQTLPSFDVIVAPARWEWIAEKDYAELPTKAVDQQRSHHYRKNGELACAKHAQNDLQATAAP